MLKALVDGTQLIACDLDEERWIELQREQRHARKTGARLIVCSGCGGPMHTTKLQPPYLTQFFAHDPGAALACSLAATSGETDDHLALKAYVYSTIRDTKGWLGDVEVALGPDVKVDVLATRLADRKRRQAFEIQLSPSTTAEIIERQERRTAYCDQSSWIVRTAAAWSLKVPTCRVERSESGAEMVMDGVVSWSGGLDGNFIPAGPIPLKRLTRQILSGRVHFVENFGYLDPSEMVHTERRRKPRPDTAGQYVRSECDRSRILRPTTGSKTVDRIMAELDDHYLRYPGQWPFDSDRARRYQGRDPVDPS